MVDVLLANPELVPEEETVKYFKPAFSTDNGGNPSITDVKAAMDGARQILMERFVKDATSLQALREYLTEHAVVESKVMDGKQGAGEKFTDYFQPF